MWVKKFNPQITLMHIHFSHYANTPECIIDTADTWKHLMFFVSIFLVSDLCKSNKRNYLSSLGSLWAILFQRIGTKWWRLYVPSTVFDFAKQSSRSAQTLIIIRPDLHWKMLWKEFLLHIDQVLIGSSKFGQVGCFTYPYFMFCNVMFSKFTNTIAWWLDTTSCKEYPFSIHIEILMMMMMMMAQIKVFCNSYIVQQAIREIEDLLSTTGFV